MISALPIAIGQAFTANGVEKATLTSIASAAFRQKPPHLPELLWRNGVNKQRLFPSPGGRGIKGEGENVPDSDAATVF